MDEAASVTKKIKVFIALTPGRFGDGREKHRRGHLADDAADVLGVRFGRFPRFALIGLKTFYGIMSIRGFRNYMQYGLALSLNEAGRNCLSLPPHFLN